jgi:hypothetical protein
VSNQKTECYWQKQHDVKSQIKKGNKMDTHETNTIKINTKRIKQLIRTPYSNELIKIWNLTKCGHLPSEDIKHPTSWCCRSGTPSYVNIVEGRTDGLTWNKGNSRRFRVGTRRSLMSIEDRLELEPQNKNNNNNNNNNLCFRNVVFVFYCKPWCNSG